MCVPQTRKIRKIDQETICILKLCGRGGCNEVKNLKPLRTIYSTLPCSIYMPNFNRLAQFGGWSFSHSTFLHKAKYFHRVPEFATPDGQYTFIEIILVIYKNLKKKTSRILLNCNDLKIQFKFIKTIFSPIFHVIWSMKTRPFRSLDLWRVREKF